MVPLLRSYSGVMMIVFAAMSTGATGQPSQVTPDSPLSLRSVLERTLSHNFQLTAQQLEMEAAEAEAQAERGIFEPRFNASYSYEDNARQNTRQQQLSLASRIFDEENERLGVGLEMLVPTGAELRLRSDFSRLSSNLYSNLPYDEEYQNFTGLSLRQPLLKNAGRTATYGRIDIADRRAGQAEQHTRRQMATVLSQAEVAYWRVYQAYREREMRRESEQRSRQLLDDNRARLKAGRMSQIDVNQAQAAWKLRAAQLSESEQALSDALATLATLMGERAEVSAENLKLSDVLGFTPLKADYAESLEFALAHQPVLLARKEEVAEHDARVALARNQRRPQLDLVGSYGINGLGIDFNDSMDQVGGTDYVSWSAGVELQIPLFGGVRERNRLLAARKQRESAEMRLHASREELGHRLRSTLHQLEQLQQQVRRYEEVVVLNDQVLQAELANLDKGESESRDVLQAEQDLTDARLAQLRSQVDYRALLIDKEVLEGRYLDTLSLELPVAKN